MPRSAINTRMVDWVLPVAQMPPQLMEFLRNERRMRIPPEEPATEREDTLDTNSGGPVRVKQVPSAEDETALTEVLQFLLNQTGHDFSHYKRSTILRRVARRLQVNLLEDIHTYLEFIRTHPLETTALLHDLLISVTNFFRDHEAFAALETHVPLLFAGKRRQDQVRAWVAGCATGEEAYSIAMLLCEHASRLSTPPSIQVFATDLDEDVVQIARAGLYPATIEADVSQERLRRFFQNEDGRYRIRKEVRERVLFSVHDVLKDSPFSRLDLITCRNLLIYLRREAQEAVVDLFHFALHPGGLLFLGSSESVADDHTLFAAMDKRHRIFVRRAITSVAVNLPVLSLTPRGNRRIPLPILPQTSGGSPSLQDRPDFWLAGTASAERRAPLFGDLHLALLEQIAPPSVVINSNRDIVHLTENAGRFLKFTGDATMDLLKVLHPALRAETRTALFRANRERACASTSPILVQIDGTPTLVTVRVYPAVGQNDSAAYTLVVFEPGVESDAKLATGPAVPDTVVRHLEDEIAHLKGQLAATIEQYEASLEELHAANEELQAMNEEARSTAEELETSKEELLSINEELTTVNQEVKSNAEEMARVNGDLQNLMTSTEIGTIFLDRQLRIKRFTPRIQELFNVISSDIGRPISDITYKISYHNFTEDVERVLKDLHQTDGSAEQRSLVPGANPPVPD